jgi:CBS domain containing-hemolysin-like protein
MIWIALGLGAIGLGLSALFSGTETGFYRAARIRLVLDALGGDLVSRWLLWLTNHPTLFIATTLVGNNLANYLASLAIVMATHAMFSTESHVAELCAPLLLAPVLFVYGELLPKSLFLSAPNRLLRMAGPLFLFFLPLFLPISAVLWGLNWLVGRLVAESPEKVRLTVAGRELHRALDEGHETGIIHPSQRELARGIFAVAKDPVVRFATPLAQVAKARTDMSKEQVRLLARRLHVAAVPVEEASDQRRLVGYVRVIDLGLDPSGQLGPLRPLAEIPAAATLLDSVMRLHAAQETMAQVVDASGNPIGILTADQLHTPLLTPRR